ncbi:MAG: NAD-dependent epimerase/dehydratase family protein [Rudaea sp.]
MRTILVFGASGPVGRFLLPALASLYSVIPVSRTARSGWLRADLSDAQSAWPEADAAISLGPLDAFAAWLMANPHIALIRVIALSSMSADSKRDSIDDHERALSERLIASEALLRAAADSRNIALTIFRPTLIYGGGTDRSLAPIARWMRRWHLMPWPLGATGLRQPVHAADLASACVAAMENTATHGTIYALGGGERLPFDEMLFRMRAEIVPWSVPVPLPIAVLSVIGRFTDRVPIGAAAIRRLRVPLIADNQPATRDFGFSPRPFAAGDVLAADERR